jgi:hypothetical protein
LIADECKSQLKPFGSTQSLAARFDVMNVFGQMLHEGGIGFTADQYDECRGFFGGISYYF